MQPLRVLLVDDHARFLDMAALFLGRLPYLEVVGKVFSGFEAINAVTELNPDLVLLDLLMPGANGVEIARQIKSRPNPPRIIMMTLRIQPEHYAWIATEEFDGFISKSNFATELVPLLNGITASMASDEGHAIEIY